MAVNSYGAKGQPQFSDTGAPDTAVDPTKVGEYAGAVGNRMVGTTTQRNTLTLLWAGFSGGAWEGLRFYDTTLGVEYIRIGSDWVPAQTSGLTCRVVRSSATPTISSSAYTDLSTTANWSTTGPAAQNVGFAAYNNGITIPVTGVYRVGYSLTSQANIAYLTGVTVNKSTSVGYADFRAPASVPAVQTVASTSSVDEVRLVANDVLRLFAIAASGTPALTASMGTFYATWLRA